VKVLQVHNYYLNRGGECGLVDAERTLLNRTGLKVLPFTANSRDIKQMPAVKKTWAYLSIPWNHLTAKRLKKSLQRHQPDLAHVHNVFPLLSPSVYDVLKHYGVPIVQTVHNYRFVCPNGLQFIHSHTCEDCQTAGFKSAVSKRCVHDNIATSTLYAWTVRQGWRAKGFIHSIDRFIVLNEFSRMKLVAAGLSPDCLTIIGNFMTEIAPQVSEKKGYALFLGRLSAEKGLRTLLDAAGQLPMLPIKIAGTGPYLTELKIALRDPALSHVQYLGFVEDRLKQKLLSEAICTVIPSEWFENCPLTALEALALGTPVVASRIGGLPELVEHHGNGMLFTAGDAHALAASLWKLVANPQLTRRFANRALHDAKKRFSAESHREKLLALYDTVIKNHHRR
jgi:glycosyltransferase involved in cell wall biosynthesis